MGVRAKLTLPLRVDEVDGRGGDEDERGHEQPPEVPREHPLGFEVARALGAAPRVGRHRRAAVAAWYELHGFHRKRHLTPEMLMLIYQRTSGVKHLLHR